MSSDETETIPGARLPIRKAAIIALCVLVTACGGEEQEQAADTHTYPLMPAPTTSELVTSEKNWLAVRDVVEKRCVVCHGCYDAPCQLKLSSPDGLLRGASKERVYEASRLEDAPLTRLGIDATTEKGWRSLGFFPVQHNPAISNASPSVLSKLLDLGQANPPPEDGPLSETVDLGIQRELSCPAPDQADAYMNDHPQGGMPFAIARLADDEFDLLSKWAETGAPLPGYERDLPDSVAQKIVTIEVYFNSGEFAQQLVSRYIFEHLFLAHLHIEDDDPDRFFRLIRSATPPGEPADELATRRPFDDPGKAAFFYRIIPIDGTILHKEHMVYEIGPKRLARYRTLFAADNLAVNVSPPYFDAAGGNPFTTFAALPSRGRYQFLLDDALFFVRSFIRGPVCYGQVAVDVIEDRFWVSFLDPDADLSVTDASYLPEAAPLLDLPVNITGGDLETRISTFLTEGPAKYLGFRDKRYRTASSHSAGPVYDNIWDGDATNTGARLTVFRHFDNASVVTGFVGAVPETAWVIDYPLFERIYYDLVAGFDVFGDLEHQLSTRLYMDGLRREGETIFLSFLPPVTRQLLHDEWYRGPLATLLDWLKERPVDKSTPTGIAFDTDDQKSEFLETLLETGPQLWPRHDPINRCSGLHCAAPDTVAGKLGALAAQKAPWVKFLPDLAVLLVETGSDRSEIYTLVHDKAHSNVAFLFREEVRREPEDDRLTIVPGQFASYPNFVFRLDEPDLPAFIGDLQSVDTQAGYMALVKTHGVRRGNPEFWSTFDAMQAALNAQDVLQAGLLDINRYKDPKAGGKVE